MKAARIFSLFLVLANCLAMSLSAQSWAAKMFETTQHDFGTVSRNAKTEFVFEIENIYEEDVHIASVRSSCGCTTPKILKPTLKTWEKGGILATFNTQSFIGPKTAAITVVIDRPYYAEIQLLVMGRIRSDIVTEPSQIDFGAVAKGTSKTELLKISYAGRSDWAIKDVRGDSKNLQVKIKDTEHRGNVTTYWLELKLMETVPVGPIQDELVIVTNDTQNSNFTYPVAARITSALEIAPGVIDLGTLKKGEVGQQRFVVKGAQPFEIKLVQAADARLKFSHDEGKKLVHVVTVQADTSDAETKDINCDIKVLSDLGQEEASSCKITGQIK